MKTSAITTTNTDQVATQTVSKITYHLNTNHQKLSVDHVIIEEPLQINLLWFCEQRQAYQLSNLVVIMRTPGQDNALAVGFLISEGIITHQHDIIAIEVPSDSENNNLLEIQLDKKIKLDWLTLQRNFTSQSGCGLCGKSSIKSLALKSLRTINNQQHWLKVTDIPKLCLQLAKHQNLFAQTGGVHGAAYIVNNQWLTIQEDIGRHNAVDKVIGELVLTQQYAQQGILLLTSRISFELVQKAVMYGIPVIIALGAPSSLAITTAKQFNITLIGFSKSQTFNVYHGDWRLFSE